MIKKYTNIIFLSYNCFPEDHGLVPNCNVVCWNWKGTMHWPLMPQGYY